MNLTIKDSKEITLNVENELLWLSEDEEYEKPFSLTKDNIPLLITYLKGLLQQLKNESNESY